MTLGGSEEGLPRGSVSIVATERGVNDGAKGKNRGNWAWAKAGSLLMVTF